MAEEREHLAAAAVALAPKVGAMLEEIAGALQTRLTGVLLALLALLVQKYKC